MAWLDNKETVTQMDAVSISQRHILSSLFTIHTPPTTHVRLHPIHAPSLCLLGLGVREFIRERVVALLEEQVLAEALETARLAVFIPKVVPLLVLKRGGWVSGYE
jgi:hypothetical protein